MTIENVNSHTLNMVVEYEIILIEKKKKSNRIKNSLTGADVRHMVNDALIWLRVVQLRIPVWHLVESLAAGLLVHMQHLVGM